MGFFSSVSQGERVKLSAEFHNAVVRTVNQVLGGKGGRGGGLSRTRTTIPVEASEAIDAGSPVELVGHTDFSWTTRPYLVRKARSLQAAIGVARDYMAANACGSAVVSGLALVSIPDNSEGDYATLKSNNDGTLYFSRTSTPTQWLLLDAQTTSASPAHQHGHIIWRPFAEAASTPWAFEATATPDPDHAGNFNVSILGGTAQAVGGKTAVCQNQTFTNVANEELFFLRLLVWDDDFEPAVCWHNDTSQTGWDTTGDTCQVEHAQSLPTPSGNERWITLVLAKLDTSVAGNIVQYRAGAIDVSATLEAGVAGSGITVRTISTAQ